MGKVDLARRNRSRLGKKRLEKEKRRKKQALADNEFKKKSKEREEKRKEREEREEKIKTRVLGRFRLRGSAAYYDRLHRDLGWKSDGFDVDGLKTRRHGRMAVFKCAEPNDCPVIVWLYAKMGLHRYNMLEGTNLQLHSVEKYNREGASLRMPASYYITCVAEDPCTGSLVHFQTSSHERNMYELNVRCFVARPQNTGTMGTLSNDKIAPEFNHCSVPKWPSEDDQNKFYVVQESELEDNDWIRLYLELVFAYTNPSKRHLQRRLSDLKIVEVMVETEEKDAKLKGFIDVTLYIKYHQEIRDAKRRARVCKRRAIVRRFVDLRTQRMCLRGNDYPDSDHQADICGSN
ncbi:hypothetical protein V5N11_004648 [Cardamine amara subsp. amara]|uniref:Uncharacterized protein n=1 Tax=Cardamine amara subsp. amara TaxID=228776 RepID=A0ABD1BJX7_CARAN